MTMQYNYGRQRGSGAFFGVLIALILGAVALGVFVHHARSGIAGKLADMVNMIGGGFDADHRRKGFASFPTRMEHPGVKGRADDGIALD